MFTAREAEIFTYLLGRLSDKEIQERLHQHQQTLSLRTIQNHVGHILRKLQAHSREEAVKKWIGGQGDGVVE
jgi:DNA-binding CsgD family transcriptional regulator